MTKLTIVRAKPPEVKKRTKLNEIKAPKVEPATKDYEVKVLPSHVFKGSLKDLRNTVAYLRLQLKKQSVEKTLEHFKDLHDNKKYIPYKKHLRGVSHHCGLGPSRRPLLTYKFIIETLKNLKSELTPKEGGFISRIIMNITTKYKLGGAISRSHYKLYPKDNRRGYLKFFIFNPVKSTK